MLKLTPGANDKDNLRRLTLFSMLCKICEMILLNRLKDYATYNGFFSEPKFGFQEGTGCTEASFVIFDTIYHTLERGSKIFSCFFMSGKHSTRFGLTGHCITRLQNCVLRTECGH